jgi:hypothetical protein
LFGFAISFFDPLASGQLQAMIAGAVSLATASVKTGKPVAAPEDISRAAKSFVDVMQSAEQPPANATAAVSKRQILWVGDRPDNNVYERRAFEGYRSFIEAVQ